MRWSGDCLSAEGGVEFEEVVRGGDQVDLGLDGGSAASEYAGDPADVLDVCEHRLHDLLAMAISLFALGAIESFDHRERLRFGVPPGLERRGRDEHAQPI